MAALPDSYADHVRRHVMDTLDSSPLEFAANFGPVKARCGKVRDSFDLGDRIVLVTTDRVSAFDRILAKIPFKGQVLNQVSVWWFEQTKHIVPNHILAVPDPNVVIAKKCRVFQVEFVVRGYMTGTTSTSIWTNYAKGVREYCGHTLPDGLKKNQRLPKALVTPTTKDDEHDRLITPAEIVSEGRMSQEHWQKCHDIALALFKFGQKLALEHGLILVDTKYEMGLDENGNVILVDEIHTPDSSRYWIANSYQERFEKEQPPENIDKDVLRNWYNQHCDPYKDEILPKAPEDLVVLLSLRYIELYERITGQKFQFPEEIANIAARVQRNLTAALEMWQIAPLGPLESASDLSALLAEKVSINFPRHVTIMGFLGIDDQAWGFIAVATAALSWGSHSLLFKTKKIQDTDVTAFVYQLYHSLAIFASSWLVLSYNTFVFTPWGILSALFWVLTNVLWNYSIRLLGLGAAAGLGSGITMAVSFVWGATAFASDRPLKSLGGALGALGVLFCGIFFVAVAYTDRIQRFLIHFPKLSAFAQQSSASTSVFDEHRSSSPPAVSAPPVSDSHRIELSESNKSNSISISESLTTTDSPPEHHDEHIELDHHDDDEHDHATVPLSPSSRHAVASGAASKSVPKPVAANIPHHPGPSWWTSLEKRTQEKIIGSICIVFAGLVNGSSLVPLKFAPKEAQGIVYMTSFGIGVLIITPVLNLIYFGIIKREKPDLKLNREFWFVPVFAAIGGIIWNLGNFSSVYATLYLGFSLGFPLTQLSLVVAALWGILFFKEVPGVFERISYFFGVALIMGGAFMLANFA